MLNMIKVNVWPPVVQVCLQTTLYTYIVPGLSYPGTYTGVPEIFFNFAVFEVSTPVFI